MRRLRTRQRTVKLHRAQQEFRLANALYRGFVGGRGAGKTWSGAYDLLRRARRDHTYLVASPTYTKLHDETLVTFTDLAKQLGVFGGIRLTPRPNVLLTTGATVRFRSADEPDKLAGPNLSGVWLDEASQMVEQVYTITIACLREQGQQGWLSATFTPKGRTHWTYRIFGPANTDARLFRSRTRDNPFLPPEFAATLARQYGGESSLLGRQELGGEFLDIQGAEWPAAYFPDSLWFDDWPEGLLARAIALDPSKGKDSKSGDYAAFALAAVDVEGTIWVEADCVRGKSAEWLAEQAVEHQRRFGADAFGVESNQWLQLFASIIDITSRRRQVFLPIVELYNQVPKLVRVRRLGPYLAQGRFRFRNTAGTHLLVDQLREFAEGEHDDGPDALEMALRLLSDLLAGREDEEQEGTVLRT